MDCRTTLEILDAARPDSNDLREPEFAKALEHLEICPRCSQIVRHRQELDEQIGGIVRDVLVPVGLRERLLAVLQHTRAKLRTDAGEAASSAASSAESPARPEAAPDSAEAVVPMSRTSRRMWLRKAAAAAACVLAGLGTWYVVEMQSRGSVTLAQLRESAPFSLSELPIFDGNFKAIPPHGWSSSGRLRLSRSVRGLSLSGRNRHEAALYSIYVSGTEGAAAAGVLLVIPAREVRSRPQASNFSAGNVSYVGTYATVAWADADFVYVCFVKSGTAAEIVDRALHLPPA
jgi:hypothetical protein